MKVLQVINSGKSVLVRVELHEVEEESAIYNDLHEEMAKRGFVRTLKQGNKEVELPSGMYRMPDVTDIAGTHEKAVETAKTVCRKHSLPAPGVMTMDGTSARQSGLYSKE